MTQQIVSPDSRSLATIANILAFAKSDMTDAEARAKIVKELQKYADGLDPADKGDLNTAALVCLAFVNPKRRVPAEAENSTAGG